MTDVKTVQQALAAPFPASVVGWKPQTIKDRRAMVVAYIDARDVMDRLDAVLGIDGWQDSYECLPDGCVVCRLQLRLDQQWVAREDVGSPSGQPDEGDRRKAAFCLPLDAEALTPSGWTSYDRLCAGDDILGYDIESRTCRWTTVRAVNVFPAPQEMLSLSSKSFNMVCTPSHRWVVHRREGGVSLKPTDRLDTRDRLVVAAPAEPGSHQLTAREASILGWLATDGSVVQSPDKRPGRLAAQFHAWIFQSKQPHRDDIRQLLGPDAEEHISPPGTRLFPGHDVPSEVLERAAFRIRTPVAQGLLSRAGLWDGQVVDWRKLAGLVTRLSREARRALFHAMLAGDGQHSATGQVRFGKKRKPGVMDAFEVLATLEGVALGTLHSSDEPGRVPLRTLRQNPHTWHKCIEITPGVPEGAWCPTTDLGTWVTRWNGQITITGNSDALKRAAVKFGIGRYIYRLDQQWVDYDPQKKRIVGEPKLPAWALPTPEPGPSPRVLVPPPADSAPEARERGQGEPVNEGPGPHQAQPTPSLGQRFLARLREKEAELILAKLASEGELIQHIRECGAQVGLPEDLRQWSFGEVRVAGGWVQAFEEGARKVHAHTNERLSQEEIDRAAALLAQKGRHFRDMAKGIRVKVNARLEDLSRAQYERLSALLGALPDAKEEPACLT